MFAVDDVDHRMSRCAVHVATIDAAGIVAVSCECASGGATMRTCRSTSPT
jgi:hypothetical protein